MFFCFLTHKRMSVTSQQRLLKGYTIKIEIKDKNMLERQYIHIYIYIYNKGRNFKT